MENIKITANHGRSNVVQDILRQRMDLDTTYPNFDAARSAIHDAMGNDYPMEIVDHGNDYAVYEKGDSDVGSMEQTRAIAYISEVGA